jgi:hypothetical protein
MCVHVVLTRSPLSEAGSCTQISLIHIYPLNIALKLFVDLAADDQKNHVQLLMCTHSYVCARCADTFSTFWGWFLHTILIDPYLSFRYCIIALKLFVDLAADDQKNHVQLLMCTHPYVCARCADTFSTFWGWFCFSCNDYKGFHASIDHFPIRYCIAHAKIALPRHTPVQSFTFLAQYWDIEKYNRELPYEKFICGAHKHAGFYTHRPQSSVMVHDSGQSCKTFCLSCFCLSHPGPCFCIYVQSNAKLPAGRSAGKGMPAVLFQSMLPMFGSIVISVVQELLLMLEEHWDAHPELQAVPIYQVCSSTHTDTDHSPRVHTSHTHTHTHTHTNTHIWARTHLCFHALKLTHRDIQVQTFEFTSNWYLCMVFLTLYVVCMVLSNLNVLCYICVCQYLCVSCFKFLFNMSLFGRLAAWCVRAWRCTKLTRKCWTRTSRLCSW